MDLNDLLRFWVGAFACATISAVLLGLALVRSRKRVRRLEDYLFEDRARLSTDPAFEQLSDRVEYLTEHMERLAAGQDLLARSVGHAPVQANDRGQVATPH